MQNNPSITRKENLLKEGVAKQRRGKYKNNYQKLKDLGTIKPIWIYLNPNEFYMDKSKPISITDGRHRTLAAEELGYTHIPALIDICEAEKIDGIITLDDDTLKDTIDWVFNDIQRKSTREISEEVKEHFYVTFTEKFLNGV